MNTENQTEEIGTDQQWWLDFRAIYAYRTNILVNDPNQRRILVDTFERDQLNHLASYMDVLDFEPELAVELVFRFLLNS